MLTRFKCPECSCVFEAEPVRFEYHSPIYGPCAKFVGECPECHMQSDEYREPNPGKKPSASEPATSPGCCCSGGSCGF